MLNMNPVVQVNVSVGMANVASGVFDKGAILTPTAGTGTPLSATNRFAEYASLAEVASGITDVAPAFGSSTDVYKAAEKYFGADPTPGHLIVIFYVTTNGTTETPTSALLDAVDKGCEFYGLYYSPKDGETAANIKANIVSLASTLNSINRGVIFYGVTGTAASVTDSSGIMKALALAGAKRAIGMACTTYVDDAAGLMGVAMGLSRMYEDGSFSLCYKSVPTATVNSYSQSDIDTIKAINGNVYVARTKTRAGLENGATASGLRFDDVLYLDRIANDIQTALYNLIANTPTKMPQNDSTTAVFFNTISRILEDYYNAGVLSGGVWRGNDVGKVKNGDIIEHGYCMMANSFDEQSTEDRAARKAMPITILLCLSGSVESIVINLDVQT